MNRIPISTQSFAKAGAVMIGLMMPMLAQTPGPHPAYLRARSDLRVAEHIMLVRDEPNVMRDLAAAAERVREAIRLLDEAAVIDRKQIDDNPRIDTYPDRRGRFRAMYQMLEGAKRDLSQAETNLSAVGWRNAAIGKVNEAQALVKKAARDDWRDDFMAVAAPPPPPQSHPHYLQALSDLRFARALLWRRDFANVMAEQRDALHEIDEAIRETGRAAIDDGRDPKYQPPVDVKWRPEDRLRRATDALNSALRNLGFEEDNQAALAWRQAAMRHAERARGLVGRAISDRKIDMWFDR
jgi:tetratricopeptide (TPR) repeat protein